jgi:4-amino-4-deoxy-L-arabinose transferase-like glycosyltransferase
VWSVRLFGRTTPIPPSFILLGVIPSEVSHVHEVAPVERSGTSRRVCELRPEKRSRTASRKRSRYRILASRAFVNFAKLSCRVDKRATATNSNGLRRGFILACTTVFIAAALVLNRLNAAEVCGSNEAVEGIFVQQMAEHGKLLFPLENGHAPMYKPPLFHWTATTIDYLFGIKKVTPFNLRLPAALYAIAGVILAIKFSWDFIGPGAAWLTGLILCGSYQYIEQGRIGRVDMTLCFFETLSLMAFMWWYADEHRAELGWLRYLFAIALGLGVLAKGPVGAVLPAAACGIFLIVRRRWLQLREIATPGAIALAVIVGGSWYAACLVGHHYAFLDRQLGSENFGRFFGALGAMPVWYYVEPLLFNSGPLSLLIPFAVFFALWTYLQNQPGRMADGSGGETATLHRQSEGNASGHRVEAVRLFAIFWLVNIAFFSLAAYKRRSYLLPLWPASAVMLTWWVETSWVRIRLWGRLLRGFVILSCCGLILFNAIYLPAHQVRECEGDSVRGAAREINRIVGKGEALYLYGFAEDPAPLLFYLDRMAPMVDGKLGDAPPGYVIIPLGVWSQHRDEALDLTPVFQSSTGRPPVILLRHGKALAAASR